MPYLKNIVALMLVTMAVGLYTPTGYSKDKPLPEACTTQCQTPYGQVLGVGVGNVPAYSNCNSDCVVFSPNKKDGTYTGIKWQCVEYARRWLLVNKGVVYGDVDIAADIWGLDYVTRVKDKTKLKMLSYPNGNAKRPEAGDLLVYAKAYLKTGHVAVISKVDPASKTVQVLEQNYNNTKWARKYSRIIPYVQHDNKYWLLDAYLLGWKRVTANQVSVNK
ncbi:MAG: CHAP domain-containing protein [Gammaproteobacteria bacterium]|jgi:glutathionylspermidine amidase/synthetase